MSLSINKSQKLLEPLIAIEKVADQTALVATQLDTVYRQFQDSYHTLDHEDDGQFEQFLEGFTQYTADEHALRDQQKNLTQAFIRAETQILADVETNSSTPIQEKYQQIAKTEQVYHKLIRQNPDQSELISSRRKLESASLQVVAKLSQAEVAPRAHIQPPIAPRQTAPAQAPVYGLRNPSSVNCGFNSVMQVVMQEPLLQEHVHSSKTLKPLSQFTHAYHATPQGSPVAMQADSQQVRTCLSGLSRGGIRAYGRQEDASEAMSIIYNQKSSVSQRLCPDVVFKRGNQEKIEGSGQITINPVNARRGVSFDTLVKHSYFDYHYQGAAETRQFVAAPELLSVNIARFTRDKHNRPVKNSSRVPVPFTYTMPRQYVLGSARDIRYGASAFIVHIGSSLGSGHYVAYRKEGSQWYCVSDGTRTKVTDQQAQTALQESYQVFYRRLGVSSNC